MLLTLFSSILLFSKRESVIQYWRRRVSPNFCFFFFSSFVVTEITEIAVCLARLRICTLWRVVHLGIELYYPPTLGCFCSLHKIYSVSLLLLNPHRRDDAVIILLLFSQVYLLGRALKRYSKRAEHSNGRWLIINGSGCSYKMTTLLGTHGE